MKFSMVRLRSPQVFDGSTLLTRSFRFAIWLIVVTAFVVSGCSSILGRGTRDRGPQKDVLATEPNIEPLVFIADYASGAINATGGMDVWMKTKKLDLYGVVTVYEPDDSFYLTEHHFEVYPWLNSIKVSAQEPLSRFVWQFSEGRFNVLEGDEKVDVSPSCLLSRAETGVSYRDYAEAILNAITAPLRFLDVSVGFIKEPGPVKMEGQWYYPIAQTYPAQKASGPGSEQMDVTPVEGPRPAGTQPYWSKVVFFQNRDSPASGGQGSLVDMVWFADIDQKKFLAVRGYDYEEVQEGGVLVPTRVEIFRTDARAVTEERLVKIDFK